MPKVEESQIRSQEVDLKDSESHSLWKPLPVKLDYDIKMQEFKKRMFYSDVAENTGESLYD